MRIVFLYPLAKTAFDFLRNQLPDDIEIIARIKEEHSSEKPPNEDPEIVDATKKAEIILGPYVTEEIMLKAHPNFGGRLKLVFIPWTGIDRLNLTLLKKYSIPVANSHGNARTVAEFAITLLLAAAKNILYHDKQLRRGDWSSRFVKKPSMKIANKIIGLLGYGAIGTECAKLLKGFDVTIIACRKNPEKSTLEQHALVKKVYSIDSLKNFLAESDIIINSLPLTDETVNFLGENEFNQMKEGVILVNVGRAKTIHEKALYEAIKSGKIFAAGLDPQWNYPSRATTKKSDEASETLIKTYPSNYPIHDYDNVVLSPHRASHLIEGYEKAHWHDVIENILRVYQNKEPINIIDIEKGY